MSSVPLKPPQNSGARTRGLASRFLRRKHQKQSKNKPSPPGDSSSQSSQENSQTDFDEETISNVANEFQDNPKNAIDDSIDEDAVFKEPLDLTAYNLSRDAQHALWKIEIARLCKAVRSPKSALYFDKGGFFDCDSKYEGYAALHLLAKRIEEHLWVCMHDFFLFMLEHGRHLEESVVPAFLQSHRIVKLIERLFDPASDASNGLEDIFGDQLHQAYYELVEFVTASLAVYFVQCAEENFWAWHFIALLAKWSSKLKVIGLNPGQCINTSMTKAEELRVRKRGEHEEQVFDLLYGGGIDPNNSAKQRSKLIGALDDALRPEKRDNAFETKMTRAFIVHEHVSYIFRTILGDLQTSSSSLADSFQVSRVVYESGLGDWATLLTSDRDGYLAGCSSRICLKYACIAYQIFASAAEQLKSNERDVDPQKAREIDGHDAEISWTPADEIDAQEISPETAAVLQTSSRRSLHAPTSVGRKHRRARLTCMREVINALVPLSFMDCVIVAKLYRLMYQLKLYSTSDRPRDSLKGIKFTAMAHFSTTKFSTRFPGNLDKDVHRFPSNPLWGNLPLNSVTHRQHHTLHLSLAEFNHAQSLKRSAGMIELDDPKMSAWTIDESSIVVSCVFYVVSIVSSVITLVGGGLGVGFSVHTRISGVDPFNITLFFWILAGFIIAVAKSLRVEDWPWRDFIMCRVVCRSVSELHAVTGVDEQLILRKLLHIENVTILRTRGPFNEAFSRKAADQAGFAIDRPLTLESMMLSGLLMVKVQTPEGEALVCLDVRRNTVFNTVNIRNLGGDDDLSLVCSDFSDAAKGGQEEFKLERKELPWMKTVGIYCDMDSRFG